MGNPEYAGEFVFEVEEGAEGGWGGVEVVEGAGEEVVEVGLGVVGFEGFFEELAAVGGEEDGGVVFAEAFAPVVDLDFAEGVEVAAAGAGDGDFAGEEEVELAGEGAFGAAGTPGDGFDEAAFTGEPVDDEAGVGEAGEPDEDGLHEGKDRRSGGGGKEGWRGGAGKNRCIEIDSQ